MKIRRYSGLILVLIFLLITSDASAIEKQKEYNILLIGNGNYSYIPKLKGPRYDTARMEEVFRNSNFRDGYLYVNNQNDLTRDDMIRSIRNTYSHARPDDVNYFYYGGHGSLIDGEAYIMGVDARDYRSLISSRELKRELDKVPGTMIIILDSCRSGGFIASRSDSPMDIEANEWEVDLEEYNNIFIETFLEGSTRSFSGSKYKLITAARHDQDSWDIYDPYMGYGGEFTLSLVKGLGFTGNYEADYDRDQRISIEEIYQYLLGEVKRSNVQCYSTDMDYLFYEYGEDLGDIPGYENWSENIRTVDDNYSWKIKFNKELNSLDDLDKDIFILNKRTGEKVELDISDLSNGLDNIEEILLVPKMSFKRGSRYYIYINDMIRAKDSSLLKHKLRMEFKIED